MSEEKPAGVPPFVIVAERHFDSAGVDHSHAMTTFGDPSNESISEVALSLYESLPQPYREWLVESIEIFEREQAPGEVIEGNFGGRAD